jgi:hypothetical protein
LVLAALSAIPTYVTSAVALAVALWTAFRQREFSRFALVLHHEIPNRLHLALLNGGTQPSAVLQLSFLESVLPEVRPHIPPGSDYWAEHGIQRVHPLYIEGKPGEFIAPVVVPPKSATTVTAETTFLQGREELPAAARDGMQFLLELRVTVASGDGRKVEADLPLIRFAANRSATGHIPREPFVLIKPRRWWSRSPPTPVREAPTEFRAAQARSNVVGPATAQPVEPDDHG